MASTNENEVVQEVDKTKSEPEALQNVSNSLNQTEAAPDPGGVTSSAIDDKNNSQTDSSSSENIMEQNSTKEKETVSFKVIFNKQKYDVTFPVDETIGTLKNHVQTLTGVPAAMQKIMLKGLAKDESTLRDLKVTKNAKVMVVGSTLNDLLSVSKPSAKELEEDAKASAATKEPLSQRKEHKKVLEKYKKPEDGIPGVKNVKEPLPPTPISGMYNKSGGKVRLTFKLELDQIWIGTKERTDKIPMSSIKSVVSEPLEGHEEYHMLGIQLGPTEASRYWIYWVPAQYVDAIKDTVLGKWQYF